MAQNLPIRFQELVQLTNLGISPESIGFATLTLESEKYICIREVQGQQTNVIILALDNLQQPVVRRPISADAAVMNPREPILALKAQNTLQLFNIDEKKKLKSHNMPTPVVFWKWISASMVVLVTANEVYHWSVDGVSEPVKVFDRAPELNDSQIINYRSDETQSWVALVGIAQKEGRIAGVVQLYSTEKRQTQIIEGHAAEFCDYVVPGATKPSTLFCFASRGPQGAKMFILEVVKGDAPQPFARRAVDVYFPPEAAADFPVAMQISKKYEMIYLITKFGYIHLYDLGSGTLIYRNRISADTIFVTAFHYESSGVVCVNRKGQVLFVTVNEETIAGFIYQQLNNPALAIRLAVKNNLKGLDEVFIAQFNNLFGAAQYKEAALLAAESPGGVLRNKNTIQRFSSLPVQPGQPLPLLQYFGTILEKGILNKLEALELTRLVLQQGRKQLLEKWLAENKLECSEELGDEIRPHDTRLALSIYYRANAHMKVIQCLSETGDYEKIAAYAQKVGVRADFSSLLKSLIMSNNRAGALKFATMLLTSENGPLLNIAQVVDTFLAFNMIPETTSLLLDVLKGDRAEDAALQTRLLEINLSAAPQVADAILGNGMFTHYNRLTVARMCEQAGYFQRALEHYTDIGDVRRVLLHAPAINVEFLANFFGTLSADDSLECLRDLMRNNLRVNLKLVVQVAVKYAEAMTPAVLIDLFEQFQSYEGLYYFLGQIVNESDNAVVHFKYIQAATKVSQFQEVERVVRESNVYDPVEVREFLKAAKLPDQLPLIIVCDRFDFIEDLTRFLYKNNMSKYIEAYCQQINPVNTPLVIGTLIDVDCPEDYIKNLLLSVRGLCPTEPLVEEVEKRNRMRLIKDWVEARVAEGSTEVGLHNALAKIYIDGGNNPEQFLTTNMLYDPKAIGAYCENRDPYLAFVAYKRGGCDYELVEVTNKHSLFKHQARYLVGRMDLELWAYVLSEENEFKRQIVDQVVQTALPETKKAQEVSMTVKAFMNANMPNELIELLEKIVLESHNPEFSENTSLQNLLIITAIKADKSKVMGFVERLDKYDPPEIADISIENTLYEEAFVIYKKFNMNVKAIEVLIVHIHSIERASDFAERINSPEVFSKLGKAQLDWGMVKESVDSFIKANDPQFFEAVIEAAERGNFFEDLVRYLQMCRKKLRGEVKIESELVYAFAKTNKLSELEEFATAPNCARIQDVGDRCYDEGLYKAARILFTSISNFGRLAATLVRLKEYNAAVEAANKAKSTRTWREVCMACVDAEEFRLAQISGQHLIIHADELEPLIHHYEKYGYFEQIIQLIESGLGLERAHVGMFTELAILYSKYKPEKLMEYLKLFYTKLSIPKVLRTCQTNQQWSETTFLYIQYDEFDNATMTMIEHSADAWDHPLFRDVIQKVNNTDITYKGIRFYLSEHPTLINDLMTVLHNRVDHSRVVQMIRGANLIPLSVPYLTAVQKLNIPAVNEALNEEYVATEDYDTLRVSIDGYDNFDQINLGLKLEKHDLIEFRRLAAYLYKKNNRFEQSVALSKRDKLYKDAIDTAAASKDREIAENLLTYFVDEIRSPEGFAATLYTCYDLVRPDVALELAWRRQILDFALPYLVQMLREYVTKVDQLVEAQKPKKKDEEPGSAFVVPPQSVLMTGLGGPLMLPSFAGEGMIPYGMPQQYASGYPPQQPGFAPQMGGPGFGGPQMGQGFGGPGFGNGGFGQ